MSIPALLDTNGQAVRNIAEGSYQQFIVRNLEELTRCTKSQLIEKFAKHKETLYDSFRALGYDDLEQRMLTEKEAKISDKELKVLRAKMRLQSTSMLQDKTLRASIC